MLSDLEIEHSIIEEHKAILDIAELVDIWKPHSYGEDDSIINYLGEVCTESKVPQTLVYFSVYTFMNRLHVKRFNSGYNQIQIIRGLPPWGVLKTAFYLSCYNPKSKKDEKQRFEKIYEKILKQNRGYMKKLKKLENINGPQIIKEILRRK